MEKMTYNAQEIAEVLGVSVSQAYNLLHRENFPTLHIGNRLLVAKTQFESWLIQQSNCPSA